MLKIHGTPPSQGTYDFVLVLAALGQALGRFVDDPPGLGALQVLHLL